MTNVLLNYYNFDGDWARPHLQNLVTGKKVLIVPLAFRECQAWDLPSWQSVYGAQGEKYQAIVAPFLTYGYKPTDLCWLNYFDKNANHLEQIANADLLFFAGGMPEKAIERMHDLGIVDAVKNFKGVVMGASAGAMLQLSTYHVTPDDDYPNYGIWQGLGLVDGLDLEVHYLATDLQQSCAKRAANQLNLPVYKMWHEGGLIVQNGKITPMGNVELLLPNK